MKLHLFCRILLIASVGYGCSPDDPSDIDEEEEDDVNFPTPDWTDASHSSNVAPDYSVVFPENKVNTIEIEMSLATWGKIQDDMKSINGASFGQPGLGGNTDVRDPAYFSVSLKCNGLQWYKAGFRLKGNSTLGASWRKGIYKLPFRLKMDHFEDKYPQIKNQRFYGFKELSMSPGVNDNSLIREKAANDIFNMAGIPAPQASFYKVFINFGDGLKYCGVYTVIEVVDDTMIKNRFGDDTGNIYKPESNLKNFHEKDFEKKNNEEENDYSDVKAFVEILNSNTRTSSPATWRASLNQVFNTDHFLRWLAANTVMLNWDSYGKMPHNFYLYNAPGKGLTWIPWDNNEAMSFRGDRKDFDVSLETVDSKWPLIRNLMDDPVYAVIYRDYVISFTTEVFTPEKMDALFTAHHNMIAPFVVGPEQYEVEKYSHLGNAELFEESVSALNEHVMLRNTEVDDFLN